MVYIKSAPPAILFDTIGTGLAEDADDLLVTEAYVLGWGRGWGRGMLLVWLVAWGQVWVHGATSERLFTFASRAMILSIMMVSVRFSSPIS